MKQHILSACAQSLLAALLALGAVPASGQANRSNLLSADEARTVFTIAEASEGLRMTVGYAKLLQVDEPFGTIIIGDDTIANATVGSRNSIIVTGLSAGSTNLIILGESQGMLMSATITVVPVTGALLAMVAVVKGLNTRERYECRKTGCTLVDP